MNYVIIGNSAAAIGAVEAIRKVDKTGTITMFSDEPHHTYSRPLISYLLLGKTDRAKMRYRSDDFYSENSVIFRPGEVIVGISRQNQSVLTDKNEEICYDKLLVATGSSPFVPPIDGLDDLKKSHFSNIYTFMTLDDANRLDEAINPDSRVLIVGAGLIGLKCAEGIAARVKSVTVVDLADRVLSSVLDTDGAARVQAKCEEHGIAFKLGAGVQRFDGQTAHFADGTSLDFDILVMAVGVRPNVGLVKDAGGAVGRGITIDERCQTTLPNVYAAGDCTESRDAGTGAVKIMALLPNAYMQGACAGANMAGKETAFDKAIPMNAVGFFGLRVLTAGSYTGEVYAYEGNDAYKRLFYSDNRLNGFILIGDVDKGGVYTSLIREGTALDTIDFELIRRKPGLMAFSREVRTRELGRRV